MRWLVTQEWRYTVEVEVEADSEKEAKDKADSIGGERIYDDYLYDAKARKIGE